MKARSVQPSAGQAYRRSVARELSFRGGAVAIASGTDIALSGCGAAQVTPQEAKRVSKVVALMRHWVELQLLIHEQALEYRRTHHVPAGKQIDLGGPAKKSLVDSMPPPV